MTNPRKRKLESEQEQKGQGQKDPKQAKVSTDSKALPESTPPTGLRIANILSVKTRVRHKSKEACTRKIYKSVRINGAPYVSKIDFNFDGAVSDRMDNEVLTLFFARVLSPYHDKHPKAYHARVSFPHAAKESYAVAVEEISEFTTLNALTPEKINELASINKLRGLGVLHALAKILNIADTPPRNVAVVDAKNLENDAKDSFATAVLHDGDSGFSKGVVLVDPDDPRCQRVSDFPKTQQGFKSKTDAADLGQWNSLDGDWEAGKYHPVPEEKKLICTETIAREHDIAIYHFLILHSALLEKFLYHICKHQDVNAIKNKHNQLLSSQQELLDCVLADDNFRKLVNDSFSNGVLENFISFMKTLAPELNASLEVIYDVEVSIREEAAKLKALLPLPISEQSVSVESVPSFHHSAEAIPPSLAFDDAGPGADADASDSNIPRVYTPDDSALDPLSVDASGVFAASAVALSDPAALPMPSSPKVSTVSVFKQFRSPLVQGRTLPMDGLARSLFLGNGNA